MQLPENFSFSQHNLQDYFDCKFRFLLKHVRHLDWPAVESEPVVLQEARMELGRQFHRLVQQYFIGVDPAILSDSIQSSELAAWWKAFLAMKLHDRQGEKQAEKLLSTTLGGHRLLAKFDLLIETEPDIYTIFDWKTSNYQPPLQQLLSRLQSRVYPLVLWLSLGKGGIPSNQSFEIEMVYWFPAFPELPLSFEYTQNRFETDLNYVNSMIAEIENLEEVAFTRTEELKRCAFCRYRSLCERGITAGSLDSAGDEDTTELEFNLDFDDL